jgi:predicted nucleotidyltransferase
MQVHIPETSVKIVPILARFKKQAEKVYGPKLKKVILYGSYARGAANQDSDIDLMIVLSEMESAFTEIDRLNDIKFNLSLEFDIHISANPVTEDTYSGSTMPLFKNVLREGIEV